MTRRKLSRRILAAAICCVAVLATSSTVASAEGNIGGKPANPDPANPRSSSIFIYTVNPGDTLPDAALISNTGADPQTVEIYAVDAMTTNTGSLSCRQESEEKVGVGSWVQVARPAVVLDAYANETATFTLQVPLSAEPGEHNGCLVFQKKEPETIAESNVRLRTRQAVRIAVTVPGDLQKEIALSSFGVSEDRGARHFELNVRNAGNVSADVEAKVRLRTLLGNVIYEDGGGYPVLPAEDLQLRFRYDAPPVWGGWYVAQATLRYDNSPSAVGSAEVEDWQEIESSDVVIFIMPHPLVLFGGALLIIGLMAWIILAIRRSRQPHRRRHLRVKR